MRPFKRADLAALAVACREVVNLLPCKVVPLHEFNPR